jgi:hypothetical protein
MAPTAVRTIVPAAPPLKLMSLIYAGLIPNRSANKAEQLA